MKTTETKARKLVLKKETLHRLRDTDLQQVLGGVFNQGTSDTGCDTNGCINKCLNSATC